MSSNTHNQMLMEVKKNEAARARGEAMESDSVESGRVAMNREIDELDDSVTAEDQLLHQVCS